MSKENDNIILFINDKKQSTEREGKMVLWFYKRIYQDIFFQKM